MSTLERTHRGKTEDPLRILMSVHALPPHSLGGTEQATLRLAQALATDHDVTLFHPLPQSEGPVGHELFRREKGVRILGRVLPPPRRFEDTWRCLEAEDWLEQLILHFDPDVCHFQHLIGLSMGLPAVARRMGIPSVLTLHDYWLPCARGQKVDLDFKVCPGPLPERCALCLADQLVLENPLGQALRLARRLIPLPERMVEGGRRLLLATQGSADPNADQVSRAEQRITAAFAALDAATLLVTPSRHHLEAYQALGVPAEKLRLVSHGFAPRGDQAPELPLRPLRLGFVGALIPTKGPHLLLDALERLPPGLARLTLVGPSPSFHRQPQYAPTLLARARKAGVELAGGIPPEEVSGWLRLFHLLVVPSIWPENAPLVVGEALREGVPVLASRVGGLPELVEDGVNGRLVPPGDVPALARAIQDLAQRPRALAQLREGAWRTPLPTLLEHRQAMEAVYRSFRT